MHNASNILDWAHLFRLWSVFLQASQAGQVQLQLLLGCAQLRFDFLVPPAAAAAAARQRA